MPGVARCAELDAYQPGRALDDVLTEAYAVAYG